DVGDRAMLIEPVSGSVGPPSSPPHPAPSARARASSGTREIGFRTSVAMTSMLLHLSEWKGIARAFTRRQHVTPAIASPAATALYSAAQRARGTASAAVLSPSIGVRAERVPSHAGRSRNPLQYGDLTRRDRPPAQLPRR